MGSTKQPAAKKTATTTTTRARRATTTAKKTTRKSAAPVAMELTHDEIASRAQQLYVESGYAQGRDEQNWLEAERQLHLERGAHAEHTA